MTIDQPGRPFKVVRVADWAGAVFPLPILSHHATQADAERAIGANVDLLIVRAEGRHLRPVTYGGNAPAH